MKTKRFVKSAEELNELLAAQRVICWKDERYDICYDKAHSFRGGMTS